MAGGKSRLSQGVLGGHLSLATTGVAGYPLSRCGRRGSMLRIDSTLKRLPDGRLAQRLSPRRKRSHWTELNKQRYSDLEARGLMTDSGRKALAIAKD